MSCRRPVEHRRSEIRSSRPLIGPRGTKPCHVTAPANIDSGCAAAAFLSFRCVVGGQEGSGEGETHGAHPGPHRAWYYLACRNPRMPLPIRARCTKNNTKSSLSLFLDTIARVISIYSFSLFFFCSIFFKVFLSKGSYTRRFSSLEIFRKFRNQDDNSYFVVYFGLDEFYWYNIDLIDSSCFFYSCVITKFFSHLARKFWMSEGKQASRIGFECQKTNKRLENNRLAKTPVTSLCFEDRKYC